MSLPGVLLWTALRKRQAHDLRFRRQHPIGPYILDVYCDEARLAVEIDGDGHLHGDQLARDAKCDAWIAAQGVCTLRLPARDVLESPDNAMATIAEAVEDRTYLMSLNATLAEWSTPEDAAAFDDL